MAARKRTGRATKIKKTRHGGPTQPETARTRKQLLLRLTPHVAGILRDQASEQGIPVSGLVAELVTRTWGHLYEASPTVTP